MPPRPEILRARCSPAVPSPFSWLSRSARGRWLWNELSSARRQALDRLTRQSPRNFGAHNLRTPQGGGYPSLGSQTLIFHSWFWRVARFRLLFNIGHFTG